VFTCSASKIYCAPAFVPAFTANTLGQGVAIFFCTGSESKYIKLYKTHTIFLQLNSSFIEQNQKQISNNAWMDIWEGVPIKVYLQKHTGGKIWSPVLGQIITLFCINYCIEGCVCGSYHLWLTSTSWFY
jgi:hypothetical protein